MRSALSAKLAGEDAVLVVLEDAVAHLQLPRSKRMPAPLPAATGAAELDVVDPELPSRSTQMALFSAAWPSATSTGRPPMPRRVRDFCGHTATSPR
jgi:hypothetical protein